MSAQGMTDFSFNILRHVSYVGVEYDLGSTEYFIMYNSYGIGSIWAVWRHTLLHLFNTATYYYI